jgi:hypothetical protein
MNIVYDYPPNHYDIVVRFGELEKTVIFTYGDTIYSPTTQEISRNLEVHEAVHMRQQGDDPAGWWERYLLDDEFRLSQEVEAYHEQYKFVQQDVKDRNLRTRFLMKIAADLSGPMYGNIVTHRQALNMIKRGTHKT